MTFDTSCKSLRGTNRLESIRSASDLKAGTENSHSFHPLLGLTSSPRAATSLTREVSDLKLTFDETPRRLRPGYRAFHLASRRSVGVKDLLAAIVFGRLRDKDA